MNDARHWFSSHDFELILSQLYSGDTRLELWSRTGPASVGPQVVGGAPFDGRWYRRGHVAVAGGVLSTPGHSAISRSFPVQPGRVYSVGLRYLALPGSGPQVEVDVFDADGKLLESYPHTMWYELPTSAVWLSQPFGFIPPPGSTRATLTIQNRWGQVRWRDVGVYTTR
jgi:hypothetical protein